ISEAKLRSRRAAESLLTVEWEGIQTGDHPESDVKGFLVEYRQEREKMWQVHAGIIPYKGPNHQYRVQIAKLPTNTAYFVRIKVLGSNNDVIVETPEIRARNEIVTYNCPSDTLTAPRSPIVSKSGAFSLAFEWEEPECGIVGEYQLELIGVDAPFDLHRQTLTKPTVSITNLLPGTMYQFRVRAADRNRVFGPWSELLAATTEGHKSPVINDIRVVYQSEGEIQIEWSPMEHERLQNYEVMLTEAGGDASDAEPKRVERVRLPAGTTSFILSTLKPNTKYHIGVAAIVDREPMRLSQLDTATGTQRVKDLEQDMTVTEDGDSLYSVHWELPAQLAADHFVVEYRLPNETVWRSGETVNIGSGHQFRASLHNLAAVPVFGVRLTAVDKDGNALARTDETTVGKAASTSCLGLAGLPTEVVAVPVGAGAIHFSWRKPECEESAAPIDGYEYMLWDSSSAPPQTASYIGNNAITRDGLYPNKAYSFKVRSRSGNGHSAWSPLVEAETSANSVNDQNHYNLRLLLHPPDAFLAWTPLVPAAHLSHFKLALKEAGATRWARYIGPPRLFPCPQGAAGFCHRLASIFDGVHYLARVTYNLTNGVWSANGAQLHFSLVECAAAAAAASLLQVSQPRIEQQGALTVVYWTTQGDSGSVYSYQVEIRKDSEAEWRKAGTAIRNEPGKTHYRESLGNLPVSPLYYVRVRALDSSVTTVATSSAASFSVKCHAPLSPDNVRVERVSPDTVRVSWSAPADDDACQPFFTVSGTIDGRPLQRRVPGFERSVEIDGSGKDYVLEVRMVNIDGSGPASAQTRLIGNERHFRLKRSVCDPVRDFWCDGYNGNQQLALRPAGTGNRRRVPSSSCGGAVRACPLCSTPRVSTRNGDLVVEWRSEGDGRGVHGYRIQYRTDQSGWNPYGQLVPYVRDDMDYAQTLTGLQRGHNYYMHIQVLDRNSYVMYTSPEASATSACSAPSQAPAHLALEAPDASHVRVSWALPPQSTWGCADITFEIQVDEPRGVHTAPQRAAGGSTSHVFPAHPGQQWTLRMRTINSAGHSAWTAPATVKTPAAGEAIVGPTVSHRQGVPIVMWQSKESHDDLIESFILEWREQGEENWRQHTNALPYTGWQRPYSMDLGALPKGKSYVIRIIAKDHNRANAFVSPSLTIQTEQQCTPPRRAPTNLQVAPLGPTQIRLTWAPLHESEWGCDRLWYIVKYATARNSGTRNMTAGENSVVFDSDPFTKWTFEVQSANPAGVSQWSRAESSQTQDAAPGPVSGLRVAAIGSDSLQLSWTPPAQPNGHVTSYEITYQLTSKGMCEEVREQPRTVSADRTSFVLTGLQPHSRYRVGVAAKTTMAGERVAQEAQTDQAVPTAAPIHTRVEETTESEAAVSWQAPPCLQTHGEITEYEFEAVPLDRRFPPNTNTVRGTTRTRITGLLPGIDYNLRIRAYTTKGPGPWSQPTRFQTAAAAASSVPPLVKVVGTGADSAHLMWHSPPSGQPDQYNQYKCRYGITGQTQRQEQVFPAQSPCSQELIRRQQVPPPPPGSRMHCGRINRLQQNQTYDFQVSCCVKKRRPKCKPIQTNQNQTNLSLKVSACRRDNKCSPYSQPERSRITEGPVGIETVFKISGNDKSLTVGWRVRPDDVSRVTAFKLHIMPQDGRSAPQTFSLDRSTYQYRIDNLSPSTHYNVTVQASTNREWCGGTSTLMATDAEALTAISGAPRVIAEMPTSVTISWDNHNRNAGSFIVEYRLEGGAWTEHPRRVPARPGQTTYEAVVDGLPTNTVVDLRVKVVSTRNEQSPPSPEARARTKCSPPATPPQGIRVDSPSPSEVRVSWARPAKDSWMCDQLNIEIAYKVGNQPEKVVPVPGEVTDYTFPAEPNQRWVIKLRATNQMGSSPYSPEYTITTRQGSPGAVRDLRVKALGPNEVRVNWLPPAEARGQIVGYDISYRLKHRLACPEEEPRDVSRDFVTVYNHKDVDYTLTGLLPYSLYEVKVRARTTELGPEETKEVATEQQPPSAPPINLQLSYALERSLSFQWEPVECSQRHGHITNYEYEIVGQDDWAKLERQISNTSNPKITIDGLTPYTKYVMRVKAYNSIGGGPNTENLDVRTAKADAPLPPQDLVVAQEGTDFFMVSWLPPYPPYGPHSHYKLRYQLLGTDGWNEVEKHVEDPLLDCIGQSPRFCYNVTELDPGRQYRVQVSCKIEEGSYGPWSSIVIANTLQVLPDAPRAIELVNRSDTTLYIRWLPPLDPQNLITQYRVSIVSLDDANDEKRSHLVDHPTLTHLFENLQPETSYNISISAGTKRGFGPEIWTRYSTDLFKVPVVFTAPAVTPDGAHALDVAWNAISDSNNRIKGYLIEIRNSETGQWQEIGGQTAHEAGKTRFEKKLTGLDPDTLYFVRIKVVDKSARTSGPSPEAQGRTGCAAPTAPPANLQLASPNSGQVRATWQAPAQGSWRCSAIRYKLEFVDGSNPRATLDLPSSAIEKTFDSKPNTKWTVRIRTENDVGQSPWSNELTLTTAEGAPGPVTGLKAEPDATTATVTWNPPAEPNGEISGYTIVYNLKSLGECGPRSAQPLQKHSKIPEVSLDGLLPDATYEVHVIAHTSLAGPRSEIITFTTEETAPTGAPLHVKVGSVTANRADVTWQQPECEKRNGKITAYEYELVTEDDWGDNKTDTSRSERVTFDSLVPFTHYRIRVKAQNKEGDGPFSVWVPFVTSSSAPGVPTDLKEEATFPHAIEVSWLAPTPPHGVIDFYRIRHTKSEQLNYKEVRVETDRLLCSDARNRDRLCYRISDLDPEETYTIQVAAHTEGGAWSDWSEPLDARTHEQNIPVLERELIVIETKPNSITVGWEGLPADLSQHVVGYVLEYKDADAEKWQEVESGVVRHRATNNNYKVPVKNLDTATEYFFRLRVVGKNDKRGQPGPELRAMTNCGKPEEPPTNINMESMDFEKVRISWDPPAEDTWQCDDVEFVIEYVNTTGRGSLVVPTDANNEMVLDTLPGTKWDIKMRTQTVEEGEKPQQSRWSDRVTLTTMSLPGELFVKVEPKGTKEALVIWDLIDKSRKWDYGVDISYRLTSLGGCSAQLTGAQEPINVLNVQDKEHLLTDLKPGSTYEITVTPRRPPSLPSSIVSPKTVRTFTTGADIPTGAPQNVQSTVRKDTELGFKWEAPECAAKNGNITQYEFELAGLDEWNEGIKEGVTPRLNTLINELQPGSLYSLKVRAYTAEGPGPWSDPLEIRTTGSELGPPRELTAVQTKATSIQLTWLPPYPEKAIVTAYKLRYSPRADDSNPTEIEISGDDLSCSGYKSPMLTSDNLCTTVKGLVPATTYRFAVQGRAASGNWGEWSSDYFSTTRKDDNEMLGGSLKLLSAGSDNLKVKWTPPAVIGEKIDSYQLFISVASQLDENPSEHGTPGAQTDYHFRGLQPVTQYNVTVEGTSAGSKLWFISNVFSTTDHAEGLLDWLGPPTDLRLIEKSETMLHVDWVPPEIFDEEKRELLTHYRVTIAPYNHKTGKTGAQKNYTVPVPGNSIKFEGLTPATIYNITVQGGTSSGYGHVLWGVYSTLAHGERHILKLKYRTPTSLHVEWDPVWGSGHRGYILEATQLHSVFKDVKTGVKKQFEVTANSTDFVINGLHPSTMYNVTLRPKEQSEGAWGAYATLPPGWFTVKNLKQCDRTHFAVSLSWEAVDQNQGTHYQVRYLKLKDREAVWQEEEARETKHLLCPKDFCGRHCYLVFNLPSSSVDYVFQVRAMVNGHWNMWKSSGKVPANEPVEVKKSCCIVPPPYFVENIGAVGTNWEVDVNPADTTDNVQRYYVMVDEREVAGESNWTLLTDKVTAHKLGIPYYVAASYNAETLPEATKVKIGDGQVIGGYLNYPLTKDKKHNYAVYTLWNITGDPVVGKITNTKDTWSIISSKWFIPLLLILLALIVAICCCFFIWCRVTPLLVAGWPWWWLLGLLLLLLLLILLCCLLLWCLQGRYRSRKEHRRLITNGQHAPLLGEEKSGMERNLHELEGRLDKMRGSVGPQAKGDFEAAYVRGFEDATKYKSGSAAKRRFDEDFGDRDDRFREGYSKGLRDAGMHGMSTSMHNLAQRGGTPGFSKGFMEGYKHGNSGVFGDRVTPSIISRLDTEYQGQEDFKQGYIDGFKEGVANRTGTGRFEDSRRLQQSLTELTERLTSLEKTRGDEIHSTKIYHVYNQQGELMSSTGAQLAHELDEMNSRSRTSTLRKHYTPGDYLKYASEADYNSLSRRNRSLSESRLTAARDASETRESRSRYASGMADSSYITRSTLDKQALGGAADYGTSRRYNYRSRSDVGSPRRYASQTLLDGARPGPSTPHAKRDAIHTLQRELDTLSRSPDFGGSQRGYESGGAAYDTIRSRSTQAGAGRGFANYDYGVSYSAASATSAGAGGSSTVTSTAVRYPVSTTVKAGAAAAAGAAESATRGHNGWYSSSQASNYHNQHYYHGEDWTDNLINIVHEPMPMTMDRIRKYSSSVANLEAEEAAKEIVEEKYHSSYKEEHSTSGR
ncbi:hypothetical protein PENTCL1PPCAC_9360, partial [Pristionchus entomophagus]